MENSILSPIYERQFRELAPLRRHICSLLPLNRIRTIFEPGCGSGLLAGELQRLTDAVYTGMDIDAAILPPGREFIAGDALKHPPAADLYVTSFFFSSIRKPVPWLRKVRRAIPQGGMFAVFGEYDYQSIGESPETGLAESLREGLEKTGLRTGHGGLLDELFALAGFSKSAGGELRGDPGEPDRGFLEMHLRSIPAVLPLMTWRIVWGLWKK
jgi:SAM-dependent methyltransferase